MMLMKETCSDTKYGSAQLIANMLEHIEMLAGPGIKDMGQALVYVCMRSSMMCAWSNDTRYFRLAIDVGGSP